MSLSPLFVASVHFLGSEIYNKNTITIIIIMWG